MSVFGGLSVLPYHEPSIDMTALATTTTTDSVALSIGSLAIVPYVRWRLQYDLKLNQAATQGSATITLKAGAETIRSDVFPMNGLSALQLDQSIDLSQVNGAAKLTFEIEVTSAAQASTTGNFHGLIVADMPIAVTGC